jgi:hypothetical protein
MPIALDTAEIFRYVFSTDREKPKEVQPTLLFHYPTCREVRKIANLFEQSDKAQSIDEAIKLRCDAIKVILAGWEHFTDRAGNVIPYDPNELDSILTDTDFTELNAKLIKSMSASELEKKAFALYPPSKQESSAVAVGANA